MANWRVSAKRADFDAIAKKYNINPVLARIIRNRDIIGDAEIDRFLNGGMKDLYSPLLLKDMEKAADMLILKIAEKKRMRIIGDYDIDGICATYILYRGLMECGALADTAIPHRIHDGYGLNDSLISAAHEDGIDTVITCDNGIAAYHQIELANSLGLTVIVTDHHEVPYEENDGVRIYKLPPAYAVVDPKREDCAYPFAEICGAVVAYKLVLFMLARHFGKTWQQAMETEIGLELLELAAFATIGDVMELKDENRIIAKCGLELMKNTRNIGLKALIDVTQVKPENIKPYTVGFVLGPCLNATGRLDTAVNALELFKAADTGRAVKIADELKNMNISRKELTQKGVDEAVRLIEENNLLGDKVLVIYLPNLHESLAGIVAGRIREKYCRPAFVLTNAEDGVKGSGRSIEAFHMYDEMTKCNELFTKYGGHKLAAGLSLPEENVEPFRRALNNNCTLTDADFEEKVLIDVPMPMDYATIELVKELELLEPFGNGNPKPQFAHKGIKLISGRILGSNKNVGKYVVESAGGKRFDMMYFGDLEAFDLFLREKFGDEKARQLYSGRAEGVEISVVYYPDINEYRGNESLQMVMKYYTGG